MNIEVYNEDSLDRLNKITDLSVDLIYVDPPFNTKKKQTLNRIKTARSDAGDRVGFGGHTYTTTKTSALSYADDMDQQDYLDFLKARFQEAYRILKSNGSMFVHLDYREVHYVKVMLDEIFGRESFKNEIIWHWDYGAKSKNKWSCKHNSILWYAKDPENYIFNLNAVDRIPYMAPGLAGPEKAAKGKLITDTWFLTICPTNGKERTGYPTQKPKTLLDRIIKVHSNKGDTILDFFAGSGTTGEAASRLDRNCILIDNNPEAIEIIKKRMNI